MEPVAFNANELLIDSGPLWVRPDAPTLPAKTRTALR